MRFDRFIGGISKGTAYVVSVALAFLLGYLDYLTGRTLSFVVFYLVPVSLATWYVTRKAGVKLALLSAALWLVANTASGTLPQGIAPYWNFLETLALLLAFAYLVSALRESLAREKETARVDRLTGAFNGRYFHEAAADEINRAHRFHHHFTAAYMDTDNLQFVNDNYGHERGDALLAQIAATVRGALRDTDIIARLGGDEFIILFPETDYAQAEKLVAQVQQQLLDAMFKDKWPVTFSVGVVTFTAPPEKPEDVIKLADALMHSSKSNGKNMVLHKEFDGAQLRSPRK